MSIRSTEKRCKIGMKQEYYAALSRLVIIGLEASGYSQWFEDLLFELDQFANQRTG